MQDRRWKGEKRLMGGAKGRKRWRTDYEEKERMGRKNQGSKEVKKYVKEVRRKKKEG